ncbi:sterol desaturase family protein [Gloeobacter kilaueensis]|uniref:Fatty acid hydroxylase n=1 Tax=Gloeobacter kilaueensis (strain ATCC BAA-2537 / CCAP 1431/1 / ULC 316 / JS1) TaxID=1183438 RepID=U5QFY0_GLOK1|nr:hypothetical protein [Gloeobacter kilaueensis]AGY56544.1 hypothetical protein GKIL_0297 [Gloeobacter kilaueensis JS1]
MLQAIALAWLLLVIGDGVSTFCYHVPEHVLGRLHVQVHHAPRKNFRHYAVLSGKPVVMLDGILGALPYLLVAAVFWPLSGPGVLLGLAFGQFHVWWRHTTALGWQTPRAIAKLCGWLGITTPEQHWQHHCNSYTAYGDIFTFFDAPARLWLRQLRRWRLNRRRYFFAG